MENYSDESSFFQDERNCFVLLLSITTLLIYLIAVRDINLRWFRFRLFIMDVIKTTVNIKTNTNLYVTSFADFLFIVCEH